MEARTGSNGITWGEVKDGVQEIHLDSWARFSTLVETCYAAEAPAYVFRGQANAEWVLLSTLDRREKSFATKRITMEGKESELPTPPVSRSVHLSAFKELVRDKLGAGDTPKTEQEWWALAQHHGLATPLLDWTYYPFLALFFAFEEQYYLDRDAGKLIEPPNRAVVAVSSSTVGKPEVPTGLEPVQVFVPMGVRSPRLVAQGGVLMEMPKGVDLAEHVRQEFAGDSDSNIVSLSSNQCNLHARPILQQIIIPNTDRERCLKWLNAMGINRARLFPDLDGVARYVNDMWALNFDTSHGYLLREVGKPEVDG
jgi:hypothetical protein